MLDYLLVFSATALADFFWARYVEALHRGSPLAASAWSAGIVGLNAAVVLVYVEERWTVAAAVVGAFVGTYLGAYRRGAP